MTVAAVTAGLAASLGAGYTVAQATLQDSSAYVTKGTAISHVNGESRRVDATSTGPALSKNGDRVLTRTTPGGEVIAINQRTGAVTTIDRGTMSPTSTVTPKRAVVKAPDVVVSGSRSWLIDYDARAVRPMRDGVAFGGVDIDGRPVDAAPGPDGSVLVLTREGKLFRVGTDTLVAPVDLGDGERAALTVAGGRTYLVTADGSVIDVYGDAARKIKKVNGVGPGPDGRMLVGSIQGSGSHVLVVSEATLAVLDPDSGELGALVGLGTGAHALGEPVEYRGRVYIPDYDVHKLVVVDIASNALQDKPIDIPGTQRYFDLFVSGGKLWANDQYAQRLVQLDGTTEHQIDKGTGNGTKPDPKPSRTSPSKTPPTRGSVPPTPGGTGSGGTGGNGNGGNSGNGNGSNGNGSNSGGSNGSGNAPPELVAVPAFPAGTTVEDACNRLIEVRLRCNQVPREDSTKESGEVIRTKPVQDVKVPVGSAVTVVFVGPAEVPEIAAGTRPIDACTNAITEAGLKCAYAPAPQPADDPTQYGTVAGTSPPAGTQVSNGQTVTIQYYDSFVMPDLNGKPGPESCNQLQSPTLVLPDAAGKAQQPVHPACEKVEGEPAAKGSEDSANNVYQQQPAAGSAYKAGGEPIRLTTHSAQVALPDYRFTSGNTDDAEATVTKCSQVFDCSLSDQTRPAVDNGARPERINKVAVVLGEDGNELEAGKKYDIGKTKVRIVKYTDQAQVPDLGVRTTGADDACNRIQQAGFTCNRNPNQPDKQANIVLGQSPAPGSALAIGQPVTINYFDKQVRPLIKYYRISDPAVHILRVQDAPDPAPAGYAVNGTMGFVFTPGTYNANWGTREFHGNCVDHVDNILYSHGAPDGCMAPGFQQNVADLLPPDGDTCNWGSVWLWRITNKLTYGDGSQHNSFDIVTNTANKGDAPPQGIGYNEPLGCVFPT